MFRCPFCKAMARTRTSRSLSDETIRQYHQCQNLECSRSFTTMNTFEREITKRTAARPLPADFIPRDAFPSSHYGRKQLNLSL